MPNETEQFESAAHGTPDDLTIGEIKSLSDLYSAWHDAKAAQ